MDETLGQRVRSVPTADAVLCVCTLPFVILAWVIAITEPNLHTIVAAAVYSIAAAAMGVRRTHLVASFAATYVAFGVLVATGSADALGVFPLIVCVPLTICAVTLWAPDRRLGWVAAGVAGVASPLSPAVSISEAKGWAIAAHLALIGGCYLWSSRQRILRETRERDRIRDVEFAQLSERQRIAADLHDGLGHALTAIRVKASTAEAMAATNPERAVDALCVISDLSKLSLVELRNSIGTISAKERTTETLADLLDRSRELDLDIALPARADVDAIDKRLPERTRVAVYRAVQESITNIVRHNRPGVVASVSLEIQKPFSRGQHLRCRIENKTCAPAEPSPGSGLGIDQMTRRITEVGGVCRAWHTDHSYVVEIEAPISTGA